MELAAELPPRPLSNEDIDAFRRDGVICVRKLYSPAWVERIATFLDDIVSKPSPVFGPRSAQATVHHDANTWLVEDEVMRFVLEGPSAHIVQQVFGSQRLSFFYDQIFVKEKLSPEPTPWHHDYTFWPVAGQQIASLWTSVDPVDASSSALEFVAGSHLWPQRFRAIGLGGLDVSTGQDRDELPDIEADRDAYDILSWELEPGDALLFHGLTLHGSRGNRSKTTRRRAITTRWCGDDVIYDPLNDFSLHDAGLAKGDPFVSWLYPQVLPSIDMAQISRRLAGPVLPTKEAIMRAAERAANMDRVEVVMEDRDHAEPPE